MFSVTTVCHGASDCRHPLVMLTNREGGRYFFGKIPEGTQRTLNENGIRVGKLKSIFLTGTITHWSQIGGLPGLFLTISDATSRGIDIFTNSSKVMAFIVATWRYFVFRRGIELNILDTESQTFIGDSTSTFRPVAILSSRAGHTVKESVAAKLHRQITKLASMMFPKDTSAANNPDPESYRTDPSETEIQTHVRLPDIAQMVDVSTQKSLNFVIRFVPVRGRFDPEKAKHLGIKPGVDFRNLTNGESVRNSEGVLVHPHQVIAPNKRFCRMVILDIPDSSYLHNTITSPEWFSTSGDETEDVGLVYHFLGDDIDFTLDEYVKFIQKFPPQCKHVLSHPSVASNTLVFRTYGVHLLKLKCLLNENFNLPYIEPYKPLDRGENMYCLQSLQKFNIEPLGVTYDAENVLSDTWLTLYDKEVAGTELALLSKEKLLEKDVLPLHLDSVPQSLKDLVHVVTLGTGSALPSIHRNVLSNLVRIPYLDEAGEVRYNGILLDGGENTFGSMMRNFGHNNSEQLHQVMQELRLVYLSHLHADHHLGIVSVICAWFDANAHNDKKLYLVIPWQYNNFVTEWFKLEQSKLVDWTRIVYFSCEDFRLLPEPELCQLSIDEFERKFDSGELRGAIPRPDVTPRNSLLVDQLYRELNIRSIKTVRAIHCYWAYSVSMSFDLSEQETFKVSFSGDTRPSTRFINCGQNTDLLIHEASLENELIEEAIAKKHTTVVEAVRVAQLMNCRKVILTHFSTRFSEKHSFITSGSEYRQMSENLQEYLGKSVANIFKVSSPTVPFEDLEICYAYDLMSVRYSNLNCQKPFFEAIDQISGLTAPEKEEKLRKEALKKSEKREAKRMERLSARKRRLE